jgi:hypothetical protein
LQLHLQSPFHTDANRTAPRLESSSRWRTEGRPLSPHLSAARSSFVSSHLCQGGLVMWSTDPPVCVPHSEGQRKCTVLGAQLAKWSKRDSKRPKAATACSRAHTAPLPRVALLWRSALARACRRACVCQYACAGGEVPCACACVASHHAVDGAGSVGSQTPNDTDARPDAHPGLGSALTDGVVTGRSLLHALDVHNSTVADVAP